MGGASMDFFEHIQQNTSAGALYEGCIKNSGVRLDQHVRLIAYYLPQFHAIPENDRWWGKGFTEWTNVTKAIPRFVGHYQPRLPGELGFYDLTNVDILRRQAELAKSCGIYGFCFHYYWFGGARLLERPLDLFLENQDLDIPFCINWANENWTRRWDGLEQQVLKEQHYSPKDDLEFAKSLEPLFRDRRYIKINGRPLLMLYKPLLLPDARTTVMRWRSHFVEKGLGNPYIIMPQMQGDEDPRLYGMDAAAGFPPHLSGFNELPTDVESLDLLDPNYRGRVVEYDRMIENALSIRPTEYRYFPGVCPSWDNEARRPGAGQCFAGSTPEKYGQWLASACEYVLEAETPDERIVFVNAWNEWAEGAYLEPDRHYGYAYLAETARVMRRLKPSTKTRPSKIMPAEIFVARSREGRLGPVRWKKFLKRGINRFADRLENLARSLRV